MLVYVHKYDRLIRLIRLIVLKGASVFPNLPNR